MAADEQRSAAENLFYGAECLLHPLVLPYQSVQNKQYTNFFRGNPPGSVPNTTVISFKNECIVAGVCRLSHAISLRCCERHLVTSLRQVRLIQSAFTTREMMEHARLCTRFGF